MKLLDKVNGQEIIVDKEFLMDFVDKPLSDMDMEVIFYLLKILEANKELKKEVISLKKQVVKSDLEAQKYFDMLMDELHKPSLVEKVSDGNE